MTESTTIIMDEHYRYDIILDLYSALLRCAKVSRRRSLTNFNSKLCTISYIEDIYHKLSTNGFNVAIYIDHVNNSDLYIERKSFDYCYMNDLLSHLSNNDSVNIISFDTDSLENPDIYHCDIFVTTNLNNQRSPITKRVEDYITIRTIKELGIDQ